MTFEWPLLLWSLAIVPLLFGLYMLAERRRRTYTVRFTNLALLKDVVGRRPGLRRHIPALLFLLGLGALLVSLARPSAVIATPRDEASVVLVLDVSGSMAATDVRPSRMEAAQQAAQAFVDALPDSTRVGLVSFASRAQVVAPLTRDRAVVQAAIGTLDADGGTAIGDGLAAGTQLLQRSAAERSDGAPAAGAAPGTVVLLSDGATSGGESPERAAARAAEAGVVVHTVGLGQRNSNARVRGGARAELDEQALQAIARTTGGEYFYAAQSVDLESIYANIGSNVSWIEEKTEVTALVSALGTVLLIAASLFSLRWFHGLP